jgi:hypothetical protein
MVRGRRPAVSYNRSESGPGDPAGRHRAEAEKQTMGLNGGAGARGRVVMLVDNGVNGDSRVQKAARSAADAGWEVVLLGRTAAGRSQSWRLGDAEVRLLPMPEPLAKRRHEFRRGWLRWPLAYPPTGIAAHRSQAMKAWRADLTFAAVARAARRGTGRRGGPPLGLVAPLAAHPVPPGSEEARRPAGPGVHEVLADRAG